MRLNKRGVALLQVLIIAAVLAGLSAMILRAVMSRTLAARQLRKTVKGQMVIEMAMKEVHEYWAKQFAEDPVTAAENIANCRFELYEDPEDGEMKTRREQTFWVPYPPKAEGTFAMEVAMVPEEGKPCSIRYNITYGNQYL